jgi:transposase InsO family protein
VGGAFEAYSIIDIYSRKLVGWQVEGREVDDLAVEMFQDAFTREGLPKVVRADSGPAMRSTVLKALLADLKITQTHNRPRVSNDTSERVRGFLALNVVVLGDAMAQLADDRSRTVRGLVKWRMDVAAV